MMMEEEPFETWTELGRVMVRARDPLSKYLELELRFIHPRR